MAENSGKPFPYYLTVVVNENHGVEAIEWYKKALNAKALNVYKNEDGTLMHALLHSAYGFPFAIEEVTPKLHNTDPISGIPKRAIGSYMHVKVELPYTCDEAVECMKKFGALVTHEPADMFYGHRVGKVVDKYGVSWSFASMYKLDEKTMRFPKKYGH